MKNRYCKEILKYEGNLIYYIFTSDKDYIIRDNLIYPLLIYRLNNKGYFGIHLTKRKYE
jgi:hypothetical protein